MDLIAFFGTYLIVILVIQGLLALIPAFIAKEKGRSFGAFWALGFFATVIIGLIAVLAMPALTVEERLRRAGDASSATNPEMLKCPHCAEYIKTEAKICRFCGKSVEQAFLKELRAREAEALKRAEQHKSESESREAALRHEAAERKLAISQFLSKPSVKKLAAAVPVVALAIAGIAVVISITSAQQRSESILRNGEWGNAIPECEIYRQEGDNVYFNQEERVLTVTTAALTEGNDWINCFGDKVTLNKPPESFSSVLLAEYLAQSLISSFEVSYGNLNVAVTIGGECQLVITEK